MSKPVLLIMAPVNTVSGYGARSRDIAHSIINSDKYDVKIWPTRWGSTPQNYLNDQDDYDKKIIDRLLTDPNLPSKPDVFVQITVPNEFQAIGKYNIGITAGIETTLAAAPWIEGCNRMDLVLTSSEHSKKVLEESVWQKVDEKTKQPVGNIKLEKPIQVLFEGVDITTYNKTNTLHKSVLDDLEQVVEPFAFLFVGHWLKGDFGEDRKNISAMIKVFLETFKNKGKTKRPALILKTSTSDFSPLDKKEILNKIKQIYDSVSGGLRPLPNIYLVHGDLTNDEMNSLYNHPKVRAHITFTKGEGYGRPLAEASLSEKPIIAPVWGGHIDFVKHSIQLPGKLTNVHPSAAWENVILTESQWFSVDLAQASEAMKFVADNKNKRAIQILGKRQASVVTKSFLLEHMESELNSILDKNVPDFPKQIELKLPKLKLPKLKKI
tara:strand:+ start:2363 stop:3673 length:1311 start_codon:yes stop_codon:yes gene_type:complete